MLSVVNYPGLATSSSNYNIYVLILWQILMLGSIITILHISNGSITLTNVGVVQPFLESMATLTEEFAIHGEALGADAITVIVSTV